jgi:hypothetical protein
MTRAERALQIYYVLLGLAYNRQTMTYENLAEIIGIGNVAVSLTQPLEILMKYCKANNLPPLTILVVQKHTGIPGQGLTTIEDLNKDREKVFNFEWFKQKPLELKDLEEYETTIH